MLENNFESPLDSKEFKQVNPKRNQLWIFIGRTDAETEAPVPWPPDAKNWLIGKDLDVGKDQRQEEKGTTEDEVVEWHHWFNGHEFEQIPGDTEGQGRLVYCSPWGHKTTLGWEPLLYMEFNVFNSCLLFSHSVVSDSLQPHGLQHMRPPWPSPTPRVHSNSCPLNQWCHPTISSSVFPSAPTFNLS